MKRNGYLFIILFLYTTPILGIGKDNPDSLQAVRECLSPLFAFGEKSYANPALQPYARQFSLSSLRLSGEYKNEKEAVIVQQGSGYRQGVFRAESYLHMNPRTICLGACRIPVRKNQIGLLERNFRFRTAVPIHYGRHSRRRPEYRILYILRRLLADL